VHTGAHVWHANTQCICYGWINPPCLHRGKPDCTRKQIACSQNTLSLTATHMTAKLCPHAQACWRSMSSQAPVQMQYVYTVSRPCTFAGSLLTHVHGCSRGQQRNCLHSSKHEQTWPTLRVKLYSPPPTTPTSALHATQGLPAHEGLNWCSPQRLDPPAGLRLRMLILLPPEAAAGVPSRLRPGSCASMSPVLPAACRAPRLLPGP
jgi:hypothetical protein